MDWSLVALILGEMALLGLVIWVVATRLQERARWRFELQARLLERCSSPTELREFLESEGGRRLLDSLSARRAPATRVLVAVQAGVVLSVLGIGLDLTGEREVALWGRSLLALGLGLLAAAFVSRLLARRWGLVPERRPEAEGDPGS